MMIAYIDEYRDRFGVEPICRVLDAGLEAGFITSRGYRATKSRPVSARSIREEILAEELFEIHAKNFGVYGVRKMWHAAKRAGWDIGRDQVSRLMKIAGIEGIRRGRTPITTRTVQEVDSRPDLVNRQFKASRPMSCGLLISRMCEPCLASCIQLSSPMSSAERLWAGRGVPR